MWDTETVLVLAAYGSLGALLLGGAFVARRRRGTSFGALTFALNLGTICAFSIAFPVYGVFYPSNPSTLLFVCGAVALAAVVNAALLTLSSTRANSLLEMPRTNPVVQRLGLLLFGMLVPLGSLEAVAQITTRLGVVPRFIPVETRLGEKTDDWRLAHVMSDDFREPDPLLLWRPIPRYPYNSQRFKGPEVAITKDSGTFRVICYGDSNTDGPSFGGAWPAQLQDLLDGEQAAGRRNEVLNAGVGGYSSYQGVMRFKEEVGRYHPDLIFISFGWNDAAGAVGRPDRDFARSGLLPAADPFARYIRRVMLRFRSTGVAQRLLARPAPLEFDGALSTRVDLSAFAENLRTFLSEARTHGVVPVVLTRPYRETTDALLRHPTWRHNVPSYNQVALALAAEAGVLAIDVQRQFEGRTDLFVDECHFTREGHRELARLIATSLRENGHLPR